MSSKIMIVEDDSDIREGVRILLGSEGYDIIEAENGTDALQKFSDEISLVILDVMMPGISGIKTCEEIRKMSNVPILFLTAKSNDSDKIMGLFAGGDDYLVKPFSYSELLARVKALLRRYCIYKGEVERKEIRDAKAIERNGLVISQEFNEVTVDGKEIILTDIEYQILLLLIRNVGRIFSTQRIYESVWKEPYYYNSNGTVMVHIRNLRKKIEENPQEPRFIKTIWGKGYRFE